VVFQCGLRTLDFHVFHGFRITVFGFLDQWFSKDLDQSFQSGSD
jgi:hypothetical protein